MECKHENLKPRTDIVETRQENGRTVHSMMHVQCADCGQLFKLVPPPERDAE